MTDELIPPPETDPSQDPNGKASESKSDGPPVANDIKPAASDQPFDHVVTGMTSTPLGMIGVGIATICTVLLILGLILHLTGLVDNIYFAAFSFLFLPALLIIGILLIPLAGFIARRKWLKEALGGLVSDASLIINLSNQRHRKYIVVITVIGTVMAILMAVTSYEAYYFTESPYFCGRVCHTVMDPEFTSYQRSSHANVACVECHIGPGASWFVQSKISGLRQVYALMADTYSRPIPAPIQHLRPAWETCEHCHWPDRFHGKKVREFESFSNNNQTEPDTETIALHIGGRNPLTGRFEGIHYHISSNVKVSYLPLNSSRTKIGSVKVTHSDGLTEVYKVDSEPEEKDLSWRAMDCIDCHNRAAHFFDRLEDTVDFGLFTNRINREFTGIREDSISILDEDYPTREDAEEKIIGRLLELQAHRNGTDFVATNEKVLIQSGQYLLDTYKNNVWPKMNIDWGTFRSHIGHKDEDAGFGCFRCHDDEHVTDAGKVISQDCGLCHDEP